MNTTHLTELDRQIADIEHRMGGLRAAIAANDKLPRGKSLAKAQRGEMAALTAEHERLVRQVQWATVGAAKPGEVL